MNLMATVATIVLKGQGGKDGCKCHIINNDALKALVTPNPSPQRIDATTIRSALDKMEDVQCMIPLHPDRLGITLTTCGGWKFHSL